MGLFNSFKLKNLELKNKIVLAPMCMYESKDGFVNDFHIIHYGTRAIGQMGLVIVEATAVMPNGRITNNDLGIWNDEHVNGLKKVVKVIHQGGAKAGIQLAHAGRKAKDSLEKFGPSNIPFSNYKAPRIMTIDEIEQVKKAYKLAAKRANDAGFDFIEIHAAHGYLLNTFLTPLANNRTDRYGGNQDNRNRLLFEVIEEVRKVWPIEKPLGIRISATEYDKDGLDVNNHIEILNKIPKDLIDVVNVSTGGVVVAKIDTYVGYQIKYAKMIKEKTPFIVMGGGLITSAELSNTIIKNNEVDLIYYGRLALREPYFPLRFAKELKEEIIWPEPYFRGKI